MNPALLFEPTIGFRRFPSDIGACLRSVEQDDNEDRDDWRRRVAVKSAVAPTSDVGAQSMTRWCWIDQWNLENPMEEEKSRTIAETVPCG